MNPQDVFRTLWAFAVFRLRPSVSLLTAACALKPVDLQGDEAHSHCLQVHMAASADGWELNLHSGLVVQGKIAWCHGAPKKSVFKLHRAVAETLESIGIAYETEAAIISGLFMAEFLVRRDQFIIEVDGP